MASVPKKTSAATQHQTSTRDPLQPEGERTAAITFYSSARSNMPAEVADLTWEEIARELSALVHEPPAAPLDAHPEEQKKRLIAWSPHALGQGKRALKNVAAVTLLVLDIDQGDPETVAARMRAHRVAGLIYESPSSTDDAPRFRVVTPVTEDIAPSQCRDTRLAFAEALGLGPGCGVEGAIDASKLFFIGRLHGTRPRRVWQIDGTPVNALTLPAPALAWGESRTVAEASPLLGELPPGDAGIVAALGDWRAHQGRKFDMCGALGGMMYRALYTREACAAAIVEWLPSDEPSVDVDAGIAWALGAWAKEPHEVSSVDRMAELVGADHAQVIGHAVDAGSFVGQLRAARAVVATPWLQPAGGGSGLGRVVNLEGPVEPLRYWCRGLGIAWAGKVVGVHGYAGSSKGLFTSLLALGAAAGVPVLGHDVARTPVLYLDAETGKLAEIRIKRLRDGLGIDIGALQREGWFRFVHIDQTLVSLLPVIETTACELRKTEGILIVLDSYSSATGGDEISSEYADGLWALGQLGTRIGALPIVTLHERKQAMSAVKAPNPLEGISGTNRLAAALASSIRLTPDEENDRRILVTCTRAPAAKFEPFHLTWCGEGDEPLTATVEAAHVATARDRAATKQAVKESKASEKVRRDADTLEAVLRNTGGIPINTGKARTACGLDGKSWGPALVECQRRGTVRSTPGQNNSIDLVAVPIEEVGVGGFSVQRPVKPKPFDWEKFEPAFEALRRGKP